LLCGAGIIAQANKPRKGQELKVKSNSPAVNRPHVVKPKLAGGINEYINQTGNRHHSAPVIRHAPANTDVHRILSAVETVIGTTTYDLQTNGTISNRLLNNYDNTISATWTMSQDQTGISGNWPDRGTGYNYYNTATCNFPSGPTTRIEPFRTGFQNVAYVFNGKEAVVAHTTTVANGEPFSSRAAKGTGAWTTTPIPGTNDSTLWTNIDAGGINGK